MIDLPGDNIETGGSGSRWRLKVKRGAPGGVCSSVNTKACGAWRQRKFGQAIVTVVVKTKALSAWQYVSLVRRSGSGRPGGVCTPLGYFAVAYWCYACYDVRDLQGFYDILKVDLLVFFELSSERIP